LAKRSRHGKAGLLFVAPFMVVFILTLVVPLVYSGYLSFFRNRLVGGVSFVGTKNYIQAFHDHAFWSGLERVVGFFFIQVPFMLAAALIFALVIDSGKLRFPKVIRILIFIPYAVPAVIAAIMWGYLYGPNFGLLSQISRYLHTPSIHFLNGWMTLPSIANIVTWEYVGYNMIIMYAALKSFSTDLYEAASMDGANGFQLAWHIKIPQLRPAIFLCLIFSVIGSFQLFTEPYQMTPLSPAALNNSFTPNIYAYDEAFVSQNINYAATISFMLGFAVLIAASFVGLVSRQSRKRAINV